MDSAEYQTLLSAHDERRCLVFVSRPAPAGEDGKYLGWEPKTLDMYSRTR